MLVVGADLAAVFSLEAQISEQSESLLRAEVTVVDIRRTILYAVLSWVVQ